MRHFVTSFAPQHWDIYAEKFLRSYAKHNIEQMYAFVEDGLGNYPLIQNVEWMRLDTTTAAMLKGNIPAPYANDYRFQANRFCQKVFAYSDQRLPDDGWRYWIDADVEIHRDIPSFNWESLDYAYLGRKVWHHSECGFLGFNMQSEGIPQMLNRIAWFYRSGRVFSLPEWHDSYVFDVVRREFNGLLGHNISGTSIAMHPWPETILGKFSVHHKGPEAKARAYKS